MADELRNYLDINGASDENVAFITWSIEYLAHNDNIDFEDFKNQFLYPVEITADPFADNWTDPDNAILFDPNPANPNQAKVDQLANFYNFSPEDKDYLYAHDSVANDIESSMLNAIISEEYKEGIRQSLIDLRTGNTLVMNPDTNPNFETNDERVGGDDTTIYPEYQDQDPWPTIKTVIPEKDFVKFNG